MKWIHKKKEQTAVEAAPPADKPNKPPLDRDALTDVVDLALWAGQLLMHNGAESLRVEETVRTFGTGLGCDWGDVLVSQNAILVTHESGGEFRTKIRRVRRRGGVNMTLVAALSHVTHRVAEGTYDRLEVRQELERISSTPRHYNRPFTILMVGLACAAFSRLFGGDWPAFGLTLLLSAAGIFVSQELNRRDFNSLFSVLSAASVVGLIGGIVNSFHLSQDPDVVIAASVLFLVPGVPFINSVEDLIKGHTVVGIARGVYGGLIILAISLGLLLALRLTG